MSKQFAENVFHYYFVRITVREWKEEKKVFPTRYDKLIIEERTLTKEVLFYNRKLYLYKKDIS